MNIETRLFGKIEISDKDILIFKEGIPGFEDFNKFVLLDIEDSKLKCLQSVENKDVCLILINPFDYFLDYEIKLSTDDISKLKILKEQDVLVFNVLNIKEDRITANMLAPIVINVINNLGMQIILQDSNYSIRQEIKC